MRLAVINGHYRQSSICIGTSLMRDMYVSDQYWPNAAVGSVFAWWQEHLASRSCRQKKLVMPVLIRQSGSQQARSRTQLMERCVAQVKRKRLELMLRLAIQHWNRPMERSSCCRSWWKICAGDRGDGETPRQPKDAVTVLH